MSVNFELPQEIESELRTNGVDPNREARELYLLELYRRDRTRFPTLSFARLWE